MGLFGIIIGLGVLIYLSFRGWSILILAPFSALIAAFFAGEPLLGHWTITFMNSATKFIAQFFPVFLLGAVFGKLMEDSGSITTTSRFLNDKLGSSRAIQAVVFAGALVTYGGVSLFVAVFVLAPMAQAMFRAAEIPKRLAPGAIFLGTATFTMSALPGTPSIQNAIPMPFFGTTAFAAPGLGLIAAVIIGWFGVWWLLRAAASAKRAGEGYGDDSAEVQFNTEDQDLRERVTMTDAFDPQEFGHGIRAFSGPGTFSAIAPILVVIIVNLAMSIFILPNINTAYLGNPEWGGISLSSVGGIWSVIVALLAGNLTLIALNFGRLPAIRQTVDAGANASVLPIMAVSSLVGFGAVVAAMPAFELIRNWVLSIGGGPLVSMSVSINILSALTGSASGGMTIALDALGSTYMKIAEQYGIDPALLHRVAVIGSGSLDSLPHNGAVVTLLAVCGCSHKESYLHVAMVAVVGALLGLIAVILLGSMFGCF